MRFAAVLVAFALSLPAFADEPRSLTKPDSFKALVNPSCSHCVDEAKRRAGELKNDDPVLCWTRGYSDGGAIPIRFFLAPYRVISDSYGVFVFDPDAGFARGFEPSYNFAFHGWRNGVMTIEDTKDGTLYSSLTGLAFEGPKKGQRLKPIATLTSTWGVWLKAYPNAVAYHMFEKYQPVEVPKTANLDSVKTRPEKVDPRMKADDLVLGVRIGDKTKAFRSDRGKGANEPVTLTDKVGEEPIVVIFDQGKRAAAAYKPLAHPPRKFTAPHPDKEGVSPRNEVVPLPGYETTKPRDIAFENASVTALKTMWDVAGRGVAGDLKGWTLEPIDSVVCKWFAWSAEYPGTEVHGEATEMVAGKAEFLRLLPKPFAKLTALDAKARTVTLLLDGEKEAKTWPVEPDAEVKVAGFWGRLEQFEPGQRVWVWLKLNRKKEPVAVAMIADERSTAFIRTAIDAAPEGYAEQVKWLSQRWTEQGLPGTVSIQHVFSGELEVLIDHEGQRWARSLQTGDKVQIVADPPIPAVVKAVSPWRERTQLRLVVGELAAADLKPGERVVVKMTPPPNEVLTSVYPSDIDRPRTKEQSVEWFLASMYCACGISGNVCTGHFYTLASCNPSGCNAPNVARKRLGEMIDQKLTDKQIWDVLLKEKPLMSRPHLLP